VLQEGGDELRCFGRVEMNSGASGGYGILAPLVAMETQEWSVVEQW